MAMTSRRVAKMTAEVATEEMKIFITSRIAIASAAVRLWRRCVCTLPASDTDSPPISQPTSSSVSTPKSSTCKLHRKQYRYKNGTIGLTMNKWQIENVTSTKMISYKAESLPVSIRQVHAAAICKCMLGWGLDPESYSVFFQIQY